MANNFPIFQRLVGLETEYAIRIQSDPVGERPSNYRIFQSVIAEVSRRVLTVPALGIKEGCFTANGGAIWFEKVRQARDAGLVEGATPECRGPRQLLLYQRAQDLLLSESLDCAQNGYTGVPLDSHSYAPWRGFSLLKNDRDSQDNYYGAQENYEVEIGPDLSWRLWRFGVVLLIPLVLLVYVSFLVTFVWMLAYMLLAGLLWAVVGPYLRPHARMRLETVLFGGSLAGERTPDEAIPGWMEVLMMWISRLVCGPLVLGTLLLVNLLVFRKVRRQLLPFLISRSVVAGAGTLNRDGSFSVGEKAGSFNCLTCMGGFWGDRPVFSFGHFVKTMVWQTWFARKDLSLLFRRRQRLQICLGDSNMAEESEYLRVGTTLLVIDAIEAGMFEAVPRFWRPLQAIRTLSGDPSLQATVTDRKSKKWTGLQLQRFYYQTCQKFVDQHDDPPEEAVEVLRRWGEVLDRLEENPDDLLGRLDWVTKKFLIDRAGMGSSFEARKTIDLRYHELSAQGYFQQFCKTGLATNIVDPDEISRAQRVPPTGTPATSRGRFIREFSAEDALRVSWNHVVFGKGRRAESIHEMDSFENTPDEKRGMGTPGS